MAKEKHKELTIEDVLVPVEEQPYEVPENWCWTTLNQVCFLENGYAFKSDKFSDEGIPVIRISNIIDNEVSIEGCVYTIEEDIDERFVVRNGDLLIAMSGATTGKNGVYLSDKKAYLNQRVGNIKIINHDVLLEGYRNYYIASKQEEILRKAYGGAQPNISGAKIGKMLFPLPPFSEQQRIVEQIERLFSMLDEAKEKVQEAIDLYDMRVKSILDKAFRGEYSKTWRDNNNVSLTDWNNSRINEVCIPRAGYAFDSKKFTTEGYQVIRMGNLYAGELDLTRLPVFISKEDVDNNVLERSLVHDGDILITLTGTKYKRDYGYAVCIEGNQELLVNQRILCLTPTERIDKDYLLFYLRSEVFRDIFFSCETGGVNQGNVSSKFVENIEFKLPSIDEQRVIASLLKDVMDKENQAKEISMCIVDEINAMKKSILEKAFRGELGTHDSSDSSALNELKNILSKEEKPMPKAKSVRIPKNILNMLETETEKKIVRYIITNDRAVSLEDISGLASDTFEIIENVSSLEKKQVIKKLKNGLYRMIDKNAN